MTLNEYQQQAMITCLPEANNFTYMMLNLTGEVGYFAGKVAKAIRKGQVKMKPNGNPCPVISAKVQDVID